MGRPAYLRETKYDSREKQLTRETDWIDLVLKPREVHGGRNQV